MKAWLVALALVGSAGTAEAQDDDAGAPGEAQSPPSPVVVLAPLQLGNASVAESGDALESDQPSEAPPSMSTVEPVTPPADPEPGGTVVLLLSPARREELRDALRLELLDREIRVEARDAPAGETAIARAFAAQETARSVGARGAIWLERAPATAGTLGTLVRAVSPTGQEVRHALLPARWDRVEARVVAVVAASLLDELSMPPQVPFATSLDPTEAPPRPTDVPAEDAPEPLVETPADEPVVTPPNNATPTLRRRAIGFDFTPYLGTSLRYRGRDRRLFSLNILGGYAGSTHGLEVATILNILRYDLRGVQASGVANLVLGDVRGLQTAGLFGLSGGDLTGVQAGGVASITLGAVRGIQASGVYNHAGGAVVGIQAAGVANLAQGPTMVQFAGVANLANGAVRVQAAGVLDWGRGGLRGLQAAGVANVMRGEARGLQAAGVANVASDSVTGAQITGVLNVAGEIRGAQIGLVNVARGDVNGLQLGLVNVAQESDLSIGLVNVVRDGRYHLDIAGAETGFVTASFVHGGRYTHSIASLGIRVQDAQWSTGLGIGAHVPLHERVFLDVDLLSHYVFTPDMAGGLNLLNQIRAVVGVRVHRLVAITLGLSYNLLVSTVSDGTDYPLFGDSVLAQDRALTVRGWPGFQVGLRIF